MESKTVCRCCLSLGMHKDLNSTYTWLNKNEIYSDMLQECFNIVLSTIQPESSSICDKCIHKLRESLEFKNKLIYSEKVFMELLKTANDLHKEILAERETKYVETVGKSDISLVDDIDKEDLNIKYELKSEESSDSENCVMTHIVKEDEDSTEEKAERRKSRVKRKNETNAQGKLVLKKITKASKAETKRKTSKLKVIKTRTKHNYNLETVLKYSNAIPFKNWSLRGFQCSYCDSSYIDPKELRHHTEDVHKDERLELKTQSDANDYHVKLDIADLKCTLCEDKMKDLAIFKDHLMNKHNIVTYKDVKDYLVQFVLKKGDSFHCAMCPSQYETFKMLKQHMNKHYGNYICQKCGSTFATKRSLKTHVNIHSEGSFKCDLCDKVFPSRTKKLYHEKTKHLGNRSISNCPFCDEPFRSYYQRNQHMVKVHNSEAQYKCNICDKAYVLKSLLMYHIKRSHLMEKNYQCSECGFKFFSKKALRAHGVKHSGEKKYKCEVCHKAYARKYTLSEHMRIHNNDRRFKCDFCGNAFIQKCSLRGHLLSHHGVSMAASEISVK